MRKPIPPRSVKESVAFEAGYAQAVIDVQTRGLAFAISTLRLMAELPLADPNVTRT